MAAQSQLKLFDPPLPNRTPFQPPVSPLAISLRVYELLMELKKEPRALEQYLLIFGDTDLDRLVHLKNPDLLAPALCDGPRILAEIPGFLRRSSEEKIRRWLFSILAPSLLTPLSVLTQNIWGTESLFLGSSESRLKELTKSIRRANADIVMLQELWTRESNCILENSDYPYVVRAPNTPGLVNSSGLAILSRYPITSTTFFPFEHRSNLEWPVKKGALLAKALVPQRGEVTLVNVHLVSTHLFFSEKKAEPIRLQQIAELNSFILENCNTDKPLVIAGDFNAEERSEAYRLLIELFEEDLYRKRAPFCELRCENYEKIWGATFNPRINRLAAGAFPERLDYIFAPKLSSMPISVELRDHPVVSDHFGVKATLWS